MAAFLFCDIPACWNSYLEEQMLKIKIFLSQASSLAACLARLYLIIFLLVCSCKEKTKEKNRQLKCIKLISKWVCRTRKSQEEPHLFSCICCCMWECKFSSNYKTHLQILVGSNFYLGSLSQVSENQMYCHCSCLERIVEQDFSKTL